MLFAVAQGCMRLENTYTGNELVNFDRVEGIFKIVEVSIRFMISTNW